MIATATGGDLLSGSPARVIDGFAIDSRTLQSGDLFFAIVAARDGHAYVADAIARGAAGAMVSDAVADVEAGDGEDDPVLIRVHDTTIALHDLGRFVRQQSSATVVALTGSAGKTTTKETIATLLGGRFKVAKNKGNLNNHLGLPLSLLELRHGADVAVMELGMNHAGEIRVLVGIAEPEIRVWTNVGDAHMGHFTSQDAIADAKAEILDGARPTDRLIVNADDPRVMARAGSFVGRRITFGIAADADVGAEEVDDRGLDGTHLKLRIGDRVADVQTPLLGRGNLSNLLAAAAVATELGVMLPEIAERAAHLKPAAHRGAVVRLPGGVTVVDDSYNSSPTALQRALEVIGRDRSARRKAAVLGEMLELGDHALRLHQDCGRAAAAVGLDRLIAVGGDAAKALADAAVAAGMRRDAVTWTSSSGAASDLILPWLSDGDLILVKGSRGIKTDAVVDRITVEFS